MAYKAVFNFYAVLVLAFVFVGGSLRLIGTELLVALMIAILTGLGIKLTADMKR